VVVLIDVGVSNEAMDLPVVSMKMCLESVSIASRVVLWTCIYLNDLSKCTRIVSFDV
jgi:hypothetical protein